MWQCPTCNEKHGDQFGACWQCGFEREVAQELSIADELPCDVASHCSSQPRQGTRGLALLAAMLVLAVIAYSLMAFGLDAWSISEIALVLAVACIALDAFAQHLYRRRFQYSLRTLLLCVLLTAIGMSWLAVNLEEARRQRQAVNAVNVAGGSVVYDYEWPPGYPSKAPAWRRQLFENDFFGNVVDLRALSDASLKHVSSLGAVQRVNLTGNQISNTALERLKGLTRIQSLVLADTRITDNGLVHLEGMTSLHELVFINSNVSDDGLMHLRGLSQLERLCFFRTKVTGADVEHLAEMSRLTILSLTGKQVTDVGLKHINKLPQLHILNLNGTQVTDAGLEYLKELRRLDMLELEGAPVTDAGIEKLRQELPNCKIEY
jgi:hypothetical protein